MALGVPVLSTAKGIEGLDVEPGRHCLVADEPEAFGAELLRLSENPALGRRLTGAALAEVVPHYDWPRLAGRFVDFVEEIAAPGAG